jgi:mandelate racemase
LRELSTNPLVTLLGGAPVSLAAYDSHGIIDRKVDEKAIGGFVENGFRAIKIKIGEGDLENDGVNVSAVRDMIGRQSS